jgi:ATP-dependent exoDNAse (exonuclease V) beta subunit
MSGVAKIKEDVISAPDNSVLKWVMDHEGINDRDTAHIMEAGNKTLSIYVNPEIGPSLRVTVDHEPELPEPYELSPQSPPYRVDLPSSLTADAAEPRDAIKTLEPPSEEAIRGIVTHRMLSTYVKGAALPSENAVAIALVHEGMAREPAKKMAGGIVNEVTVTASEPFLAGLISSSHPVVETEWPLEDMTPKGSIRSGIIDLAVFDGTTWWIIDFKTSRPGEGDNLEDFLQKEEEKYRPQTDNYRTMVKNFINDDTIKIRSGIYLTALQLWREIKSL